MRPMLQSNSVENHPQYQVTEASDVGYVPL
jgi:hypothetical protein